MEFRPAPGVSDGSIAAATLERRYNEWDNKSNRYQKSRLSFVLVAIFVGPLAVVLLAIQAIAVPHGWLAVRLIFAEVLLLIFALCIPFLKLGRSHDLWIAARVRAEVIRREQSLLLAEVGPYLGRTPDGAAEEVSRRLGELDRDSGDSSELLTSTRAPVSWRNDLENAGAAQQLADVRDRAALYLQKRVVAQQDWFTKKCHDHEQRSRRLENTARGLLTLALVLAAVHLGTLLWPLLAGQTELPSGTHHGWVSIAALWLPAIGAAVVGYRSALGSQRQALSYRYYASAIAPLRSALHMIAGEGHRHEDAALNFKRLVLDVEEVLSDELRQWWMNMVIKEPHTTA